MYQPIHWAAVSNAMLSWNTGSALDWVWFDHMNVNSGHNLPYRVFIFWITLQQRFSSELALSL